MTDDLKARLREACKGHPYAEIPWPHRLLHEAADRIAELERERDHLLENARRDAWAQNAFLQLLHEHDIKPGSRDLLDAAKRWEARAEAAERERDASIPPLPGLKGRTYACKDSDGQWYYLNHARTWQGYHGPEAAWNKGNRLDVSGLRSLPSDWDGYGAPPISEHALVVAEAIHAVPMSDGGIMIEGHGGGGSLEIAINASGYVELVSWEPATLDQKESDDASS